MRQKSLLTIVASVILITGCTANYSQDATGFATGISDLKTANTTLSDNRAQVIQTYYGVLHARHKLPPIATDACHDFEPSLIKPDDRRDCFVWDQQVPKDIIKENEAGRERAKRMGIILPPDLPPVPAPSGPATPLTPDQIRARLKEMEVPDVCIDDALSSSNVQDTSKKTETPDEVAQRQYIESFPTQQRVFMALDDYAQGLAAITKQSDIDDYKTAATKLSTSVGTLATAAGTFAGGAGAVIAGPVAKAVTTLVLDIRLAALERDRYQALKKAVLAACIPIHAIGVGEQVFMSAEYRDVQIYNKKILDSIMYSVPQKPNDEAIKAALATFKIPATPPDRVIKAFVKAHDKLMQDVLDGKGQTQAAMEEISGFAADAKALRDAFQTKKTASGGS